MRTVKEVSELTGISVRALHYYDAIGLLKPTTVTEAGYRLYDDAALQRLQSILLFRELQFPLKEIKSILDSPSFDAKEAIEQQIRLLELQYQHIGELISFAREMQTKGVSAMDFAVFDQREIEQYKAQARERWGDSAAYQEYEERGVPKNKQQYAQIAHDMMALFSAFGAMRHMPADDQAVQEKVAALQAYISEHFYACTDEILSELGEMYVCDERFRQNIDQAGGAGTAQLVKEAISVYCAS